MGDDSIILHVQITLNSIVVLIAPTQNFIRKWSVFFKCFIVNFVYLKKKMVNNKKVDP